MRSRSHLGLLLGLALLVAPAPGLAGPTPAEWREDPRTLAGALTSIHRDAGRRVPPDSLRGAVADLDRRIPALQPHEVILGMARVVARVGDGHTRLGLPVGCGWESDQAHSPTPAPRDSTIRVHHLPVRCRWDDDGLAIDTVRRVLRGMWDAGFTRAEVDSAPARLARMRGPRWAEGGLLTPPGPAARLPRFSSFGAGCKSPPAVKPASGGVWRPEGPFRVGSLPAGACC